MAEKEQSSNAPEKRHALYYPYIHIRDENWLKGAILGFQQVRRILPAGSFTVKDGAITEAYSKLDGPAGPLLCPVRADETSSEDTQRWLRTKIEERLSELKAKYSKEVTSRTIQGDPDEAFQMHAGKILDEDFVEKLKGEGLAWHIRDPNDPDSINWLAMHPTFGSAFMSVLAIAIARRFGLSVVTPSGSAHHELLLANREEDVIEKLLENPQPHREEADQGATVEELAHVVITTGFDLTRFKPKDIQTLVNEGKDLRAFREKVAAYAASIPAGVEGEERVRRLRQEAEAILHEWREYSSSLPSFAKAAIIDEVFDKAPDKLIEVGLAAAAAGAVTTAMIGAVPGLAISVVVAAGVKMFRRPDTPLRFLSKVNSIAEKRIGSIYVPQWRAIAAQSA